MIAQVPQAFKVTKGFSMGSSCIVSNGQYENKHPENPWNHEAFESFLNILSTFPNTQRIKSPHPGNHEKEWDEMCKTLNIEFVPTVIIVDDAADTAKLLTPDIHFDEVQECFDQILEEVR